MIHTRYTAILYEKAIKYLYCVSLMSYLRFTNTNKKRASEQAAKEAYKICQEK